MEMIKTPLAEAVRTGDEIVITHSPTGMKTTVPVKQFQAWLIQQLRKELVLTKDNKEPA